MIRKRLPTTSSIISPQGSRKLSHSGSKPKIAANRRKKSAQDLTRSTSPESPSFFFCDDPRAMNIKEQVCVCVCVSIYMRVSVDGFVYGRGCVFEFGHICTFCLSKCMLV